MPSQEDRRPTSNRWAIPFTAALCLAAGTFGGAWFMQRRAPAVQPAQSAGAAIAATSGSAALPAGQKVVVSIPNDALERMQLSFDEAKLVPAKLQIRVPGTVEANGYREVPVTPIAAGIVTEISAELGQTVKRGQQLARIFSQELADAQTTLISINADLEVTHRKLLRTEELVKLGAVSRQELEEVEGEHQSHNAHIEQAKQKLTLLGLTPAEAAHVQSGSQVSSEISVRAPIDGMILSRTANLGQVVGMGQELLKVTDLSSVWVEGNLLEDHFSRIRKGTQAVITSPAYPGRVYRGAVDYIDPRVDPQTRTAKVRVIIPNRDLGLRLGMFVDIEFTTPGSGPVTVVPSIAVQQVGTDTVVYVVQPGQNNPFEQRAVTTGDDTSAGRQILSGLNAGERVVTNGSFLLRAEALRQNGQ